MFRSPFSRDSNHYGIAAWYSIQAADLGLLVLVFFDFLHLRLFHRPNFSSWHAGTDFHVDVASGGSDAGQKSNELLRTSSRTSTEPTRRVRFKISCFFFTFFSGGSGDESAVLRRSGPRRPTIRAGHSDVRRGPRKGTIRTETRFSLITFVTKDELEN